MPDTHEIEPALTAEEWARIERDVPIMRISTVDDVCSLDLDDKVAAIAIANHTLPDGDPRKITRDDVDFLEWVAEQMRKAPIGSPDDDAKLDRFADRLRALLPPEEPPHA